MLGLHCCEQAFSGCGESRLLYFVIHGLLIVVTFFFFFAESGFYFIYKIKETLPTLSFKKCVGIKYIYQKICHANHFKHTGQWR